MVASDRGPGFYSPKGAICPEYSAALRRYGFRPWQGDDARSQPADMPDVLLHESVSAWVKDWLAKHPVKRSRCMDAMESELRGRLKECAAYINKHYQVKQVCLSFPDRVRKLKAAKGERLRR